MNTMKTTVIPADATSCSSAARRDGKAELASVAQQMLDEQVTLADGMTLVEGLSPTLISPFLHIVEKHICNRLTGPLEPAVRDSLERLLQQVIEEDNGRGD